MNAFSKYHPIINFLFFAEVIGFSMFLMHPATLLISLVCSFAYSACLDGNKAVMFSLKFNLPVMLAAAFINPAFNHEGLTVLCYLPSGNPLTLESIFYGLASAVMLSSVLLWFRSCTKIMTSDKFVYLFGKIIPSLSLVLSMALRFVPKFAKQFEVVKDAQKAAGKNISEGNIFKRLKNAVKILSIMITWLLENAVETADSMKSRGYGLKGRTAFSIYRFGERDKVALAWLLFCGIFILSGILSGGLSWNYFPAMSGTFKQPITVCFLTVYLLLCLTPVFIDRTEERIWHSLKLKI